MTAHVMTMDATAETDSLPAPAPAPATARYRSWTGRESLLQRSARAALAWPLFVLVAVGSFPGGAYAPAFSQGVFALAVIFVIMVFVAHRGASLDLRRFARFSAAVLGTGLLGELLASALTAGGEASALSTLEPPARAVALWLLAVFVYEVGPIVAAASRLTRGELRAPALSVVAHVAFIALALLGYLYEPTHRASGTTWFVSPWIVASVAIVLSAARCGPERETHLPPPRSNALFGVAAIVGLIGVAFLAREWSALARALHGLRWGASPAVGASLGFAAMAIALSFATALTLLFRAFRVRSALWGTVQGLGDGGLTVEREGHKDPMWVVLEGGALPEVGSSVTLLGARAAPPDAGPFRDGAARLSARRLFIGAPRELAAALAQRASVYLLWGVVSGLGLIALLRTIV